MVSYGCPMKMKILWFDLMVVHVDGCLVDGCLLTLLDATVTAQLFSFHIFQGLAGRKCHPRKMRGWGRGVQW